MLLGELSLRSKLAGLLVAASVIPLGVSAFFDIREMREKGIKDAAALLAEATDQFFESGDPAFQSCNVRTVVR
ncbi:MAG: hypothetical protein V4639_18750 [Pseudomonadota bacterium]